MKKEERIGEQNLNNQNCLMTIISYNRNNDIIVEFQDKYKANVHTSYQNFLAKQVKNPYYSDVFNKGMIGVKYPSKVNGKNTKEYNAWFGMLERCYDKSLKDRHPTYENVVCCKEWLLYENFYEWLHSQPNFDKWFNGNKWAIDKDIIKKGNKIYSPENCCLVPLNINNLFLKGDNQRGNYPIGVSFNKRNGMYCARISKSENKDKYREFIGYYDTATKAFLAYKKAKEAYIKQVAQAEYDKGNITKQCYEAMMRYQVEITD